jgi:hypothetical protein
MLALSSFSYQKFFLQNFFIVFFKKWHAPKILKGLRSGRGSPLPMSLPRPRPLLLLLPRLPRPAQPSPKGLLAAEMRKVPEGMLPFGKKASKALETLVGRQGDSIRKKSAVLGRPLHNNYI